DVAESRSEGRATWVGGEGAVEVDQLTTSGCSPRAFDTVVEIGGYLTPTGVEVAAEEGVDVVRRRSVHIAEDVDEGVEADDAAHDVEDCLQARRDAVDAQR